MGAILAPGRRTVAAVVRVMGKSHDSYFQNYHRVLLGLLLDAFVPEGPGGIGIDETIAGCR
jgi:hypothetical protein